MFGISPIRLTKETKDTLSLIDKDWDNRYTASEWNLYFSRINGQTPEKHILEGRIVMLWWLSKYDPRSGREIPSYFYFKYGISFVKEIKNLNKLKLLDQFKLTDKGNKLLKKHWNIVEEHRDPDGTKRAAKRNAETYTPTEINLTGIVLNNYKNISETVFQNGFKLLGIAEELSKKKHYTKSILSIIEAWKIGYQVPATFKRAAINARQLKNYQLEKEILILARKSFMMTINANNNNFLNDGNGESDWIEKRLYRLENINRKNV